MIFIGKKEFYKKLVKTDAIKFTDIETIAEEWAQVKESAADGESLFFAGLEGREVLKQLWIESYDSGTVTEPVLSWTRQGIPQNIALNKGKCGFLFIHPEKPFVYHGIDEEIRADFIPLVEARGGYGNLIGYPAALIRNYADSLAGGRYKGSFWYIFLFENPEDVISMTDWQRIIDSILEREKEKCYISRLGTEYPIYNENEKIKIECRVTNLNEEIASVTIKLEAFREIGGKAEYEPIGEVQRCLNSMEEISFHYDWYPENKPDFITIRAGLYKENRFLYGIEREKSLFWIDREECGTIIRKNDVKYPVVEIRGTRLEIDGNGSFFAGTHYYPSSSFYEWTWVDFRADKAKTDIEAMSEHGIRILRIWSGPILDESSLSGLEACLELCGRVGIVVIVTIFTSWLRWLEINLEGNRQKMEIMDFKNDAFMGLFLKNIEFQSDYVAVLVQRFKADPGIIWDISNEFGVMDPGEEQIDHSKIHDSYQKYSRPYSNNNLFIQWAKIMTDAIRANGGEQPVIQGTSCWDMGSDNYLATGNGDVISWHSYASLDIAGKQVLVNNVTCLDKPLLIEEFGKPRPGIADMSQHYDELMHYFLGTGAAGGCSYEWGVSWLTRELPFLPAPLKYANTIPPEQKDPRIFNARNNITQTWPDGSIGICPWAGSFEYGMNYPCTPCPSPEIKIMEKIAWIGENLAFEPQPEKTYLVVPMEYAGFVPFEGYHRKVARLYATMEELWRSGTLFGVWQEDRIGSLPDSARVVIFPNEDEIKNNTAVHLKKLEETGVKVYTGGDFRWKEDEDAERIQFAPSEESHLLIRPVKDGKLIFLNHLKKVPETFQLFVSGTKIEIDLKSFGLVLEKQGKITMVENSGKLVIVDQPVADSDGKRYVIRSNDEKDLRTTKEIVLIFYERMTLTIDGRFTKAEVLDAKGRRLDQFLLESCDGHSLLRVNDDLVNHRVRIT